MAVFYRIAKRRHPIYDATGARLVGGRWSSPGVPVIYAAEHYATALLEILVHHGRLGLPGPHHAARIQCPDDLPIERFDPARWPHWAREGSVEARRCGDAWVAEARSAVLLVPSVPGQPAEWNVVINPAHPDAPRIRPEAGFDVVWDGRLFGPGTAGLS